MNHAIYYILGGLLVLYFAISMYNKKQGRRRKSRSFMEGRRLRDRKDEAGPTGRRNGEESGS